MSRYEHRDASPLSGVGLVESDGPPSSSLQRTVRCALSGSEHVANLYRQIAEHTSDVLWVVAPRPDGALRIVFENNAYVEAFGADGENTPLDETAWLRAVETGEREAVLERFHACLTTDRAFDEVLQVVHADGTDRWWHAKAFGLGESGRGLAHAVMARDITELKRREQALEESESLLRMLADSTPAYIAYVGANDLRYRFVNAKFLTGFGLPHDRIVGAHIRDVIGTSNYEFALPYIESVRAGQPVFYENVFHLQSGKRWIRVNYVPDFGPGGEVVGIVVLSYDITDRKQAEQELQRKKNFEESLIETAQAIVVVLDTEGRILRFNRYLEDVSGRRMQEEMGRDWFETFVPEAERERGRRNFREVLAGANAKATVNSITTAEGSERIIEWHGKTLLDEDGELLGLLAVGQDITERRRAEEERARLEEHLLQSQKLEAIGKLAGGVAHDMNNVLAAILGFASVLQLRAMPGTPDARYVDGIMSASKRGADLTRNLLGFARKGNYRRVRVSPNAMVREACAMLEAAMPKDIELRLELEEGIRDVEGDPNQLQQVVVNLILNAVDAMAGTGTITLRMKTASGPDTISTGMASAPYVRFEIQDTGAGMDRETLSQAFEPFFTTKRPGEGTGLGLSMVYGTVKNHGGVIALASDPGHGTTVTIHLPCATSVGRQFDQEEAPSSARRRASRARRVLVVDDEPMVRASVGDMLEALGYETVLVKDGETALNIVRDRAGQFSVVLLDLIMPVMSGEETLLRLREVAPQLPVLLCTGHNRERETASLCQDSTVMLLQKPFDIAKLETMLDSLLDAPRQD
jgi:PAS domain S-box-containing protein